jgi:hypothetical protein
MDEDLEDLLKERRTVDLSRVKDLELRAIIKTYLLQGGAAL